MAGTSTLLNKAKSVPGLFMLGMTFPKEGGNHAKVNTLQFHNSGAPIDLHVGVKPTKEAFDIANYLKDTPAWRIAGAEPRAQPPEDVQPKNMRWPRVSPAWLKHDKQVLRFYAYFQEHVVERWDENSRYRQVVIMYNMEDGTISMSEPKIENSGIPQGRFLKRHQVPREDGTGFVGPTDFSVGEQITFYGRTYHITGCDRFTRWFYSENGIELAEDEPLSQDMWQKSYTFNKIAEKGGLPPSRSAMESKHLTMYQLGHPPANKKLVQFLLNDKKVLRFKAYWDDETLYGNRMYFIIHFFLADNSMEINEAHARNSGRDKYPVFYKRGPLLKENRLNAYPGMLEPDPQPYQPADLIIGQHIDVWGRKVVLYDCDDFTQDFYQEYLSIDQRANTIDVSDIPKRHAKLRPPPHNGIGWEEDSLQNCLAIQPKAAKQDLVRLMTLSGEILRFEAVLANGEPEDENRKFIVGFFPADDSIACWELMTRNSGHMGGKFAEKKRLKNPETGKYFTLQEIAVGKTVTIKNHPLLLLRADEHTLRYLEERPREFPFADPESCARRLAPLRESNVLRQGGVPPDMLKEVAADYGIYLLDHEVITLLRHYCIPPQEDAMPMIDGPRLLEVIEGR
eukprot:TRINITY_DN50662_c0_g1_i1.p1 TRINITY_DN50662_c0_g1~~TRINITY_DN50662_c0_g1_i1.p1  ORF type:complete len:623 (-),score=80.64 TRINITY_DN50662_c0_g1_i1:117-1985(-)